MPARHGYITPDAIPTDKICRVLFIPDDPTFRAAVDGALTELAYTFSWEEVAGVTVEAAAEAAGSMLDLYFAQNCEETIMPTVDVFYHRLNQNTNGGGITANTETPIPFNTAGANNHGNVSLASNVFTLVPGLYRVEMRHKITPSSGYLNIYSTDVPGSFLGDDNDMGWAIGTNLMLATVDRIVNAVVQTDIRFLIQHGTTVATTFFGAPKNRSGYLEMYGAAFFTRLGAAE